MEIWSFTTLWGDQSGLQTHTKGVSDLLLNFVCLNHYKLTDTYKDVILKTWPNLNLLLWHGYLFCNLENNAQVQVIIKKNFFQTAQQ